VVNHAGLDYVVSRVGLALQGSFRGLYLPRAEEGSSKVSVDGLLARLG
jgi:hypothetical protein